MRLFRGGTMRVRLSTISSVAAPEAIMRNFAGILAGILLLAQGTSFAQGTLLDDVKTVGADNAPVPVEHHLTIAAAGNYEVQLTDLGAPGAPLAQVQFAVTSGITVVGTPRNSPGVLA